MAKKQQFEILSLPPEGFGRLPQVLHALGLGRTSFLEGVKKGRFPQPVQLGDRAVGWRVEEIRELIERLGQPHEHPEVKDEDAE